MSSSHPIFLCSFLLTFMVMAIPTRLVHIFQFARPEGFVADKISDKDKDADGKPRKYDNRQNSYWYRQKKEREEAEKKLRLEKEIESADLDEMAAAAGSAVGLPVSGTTASSGATSTAGAKPSGAASDTSALASSNKPKGSRTSGRKRSGDQISYNENAGDKEFEKQLRAFEKQRPAPVLKGFASIEGVAAGGKKTAGEYDSDYDSDDEEEKELRPIDEIIDALYEPGHKLTFSFLAPDTHLTGPCYRDFNRYVKTFPGWTAKRIKATDEEKNKYKFKKKGSAYFLKLVFTIPGKAVAKKKAATGTSASKTKSAAKNAAEEKNPILAEAAALAARQLEARKAREAQEPAKKKAKKEA